MASGVRQPRFQLSLDRQKQSTLMIRFAERGMSAISLVWNATRCECPGLVAEVGRSAQSA